MLLTQIIIDPFTFSPISVCLCRFILHLRCGYFATRTVPSLDATYLSRVVGDFGAHTNTDVMIVDDDFGEDVISILNEALSVGSRRASQTTNRLELGTQTQTSRTQSLRMSRKSCPSSVPSQNSTWLAWCQLEQSAGLKSPTATDKPEQSESDSRDLAPTRRNTSKSVKTTVSFRDSQRSEMTRKDSRRSFVVGHSGGDSKGVEAARKGSRRSALGVRSRRETQA